MRFPVIPLLEHFAEKLHAYTRPRTARTRVKDLAVEPSPLLKQGLEAVCRAVEARRPEERLASAAD